MELTTITLAREKGRARVDWTRGSPLGDEESVGPARVVPWVGAVEIVGGETRPGVVRLVARRSRCESAGRDTG